MREEKLIAIRRQIDRIDGKIIQLLNQRMEIALRSRKYKGQVFDPEREEEVFANVRRFSHNLVRSEFSEGLYRDIIEESRYIQETDLMLIGFQGEHGAYSEAAALKYDPSYIPIPCREFNDVFDEVEGGLLDFGIVPVENSLEGAVTHVNDLLIERDLNIIGEVNIPVHHCLLALPETDYKELKVVYSHPQALAQCREFILRHRLEPRPFYDTAGAAKMLSEERLEAAGVIANRLSAELYHLEVIKEDIEDHPSNFTRFIVLARENLNGPGNKCSIIFSVRHKAGALFNVLKILADAEINLTRIESRPERRMPGNYIFFADLEGSDQEARVKDALDAIQKAALTYKFLGCYMAAEGAKG